MNKSHFKMVSDWMFYIIFYINNLPSSWLVSLYPCRNPFKTSLSLISDSCKQSHYIEVAQGGKSSRARQNWLWIFSLFWAKTQFKNQIYKRDIMPLKTR